MGVSDLLRRRADLYLGSAREQPGYVYRGSSVELPPEVHAVVHDESLPEHVRGFHLARHLLSHKPAGQQVYPDGHLLGQNWHRDSYYASRDAETGGGPGRTPYVLKALEPSPEHILSDGGIKGHPMWLHPGSPVHFTSVFWHHPDGDGEGELNFPEPVTARA